MLARGTGSCTEATYAFVAICRCLGVPARWLGGTMRRGLPSGRGLDTMFHRMAEAWIPGHGWLPVEPTRGRVEGGGVGTLSGAMLQLAVGDGSGDAGTGSSYFARNRWETGADGQASSAGKATCRAIWLPGVDDACADDGRGARRSHKRARVGRARDDPRVRRSGIGCALDGRAVRFPALRCQPLDGGSMPRGC